ncbi:hypothetical protein BN14_03239 [Rhizoctonia solani AG-1 IB]|uniref:Uncharacterized protein n=1 Tax=Thanatephorus cucumeris (strain AG1-IB / isolate 7/3/14) TaxID=1108050 RepID=M5BPY8_THACB|nr:hypothetical protein BN14_03239 [Rhizoctonia solani AG-1 IB]
MATRRENGMSSMLRRKQRSEHSSPYKRRQAAPANNNKLQSSSSLSSFLSFLSGAFRRKPEVVEPQSEQSEQSDDGDTTGTDLDEPSESDPELGPSAQAKSAPAIVDSPTNRLFWDEDICFHISHRTPNTPPSFCPAILCDCLSNAGQTSRATDLPGWHQIFWRLIPYRRTQPTTVRNQQPPRKLIRRQPPTYLQIHLYCQTSLGYPQNQLGDPC